MSIPCEMLSHGSETKRKFHLIFLYCVSFHIFHLFPVQTFLETMRIVECRDNGMGYIPTEAVSTARNAIIIIRMRWRWRRRRRRFMLFELLFPVFHFALHSFYAQMVCETSASCCSSHTETIQSESERDSNVLLFSLLFVCRTKQNSFTWHENRYKTVHHWSDLHSYNSHF